MARPVHAPSPHITVKSPVPDDRRVDQNATPAATASTSTSTEKPISAPETPAPSASATNNETQRAASTTTSPGDTTARAIAQPLPELPDDLRDQAYRTVATARFTIHADGSIDVDLVKATPNPRLNQLLLEVLRKWRFSPAMQAGHPMESRQDIRVHFNVD
ncbi:TonB family protein [Paraburkholderia sp. D15]|uniref:energy transducer TonB n=1 Tax=Paraburkholderia sp. D15 TaxID=2880218 RepID=UPI002479EF67|nr:TonB family protein [Paraburkholderia sp. D15]WGS52598.1 TonB family protein [Paraburkholderia sp. D15]